MYPKVKDPQMVGKYNVIAKAGGGYVWDVVLEYRVWCHPHDDNDYCHVFETYQDALAYSSEEEDAESPLALILQKEYIDEPEPGHYVYVKEQRIAEWPVEFLCRPQRNRNTITDFLSPNAPSNRLDILRGLS
jgi:hypothetical protein